MFLEALCCFQISILLSFSYRFMKCLLTGCYFLFNTLHVFSTKALEYTKSWIETLEDDLEDLEAQSVDDGLRCEEARVFDENSRFINQENINSVI